MSVRYLVGTAGWSLPRTVWPAFAASGSHLERYAARLTAAEINSSFYRPHRIETYARWAAQVPRGFRFSVKLPRRITHELGLTDSAETLDAFLSEASGLRSRLGCILVQLPPGLVYDGRTAGAFFRRLRVRYDGPVALEPRHPSWFTPAVARQLERQRVSRVAADPARVPAAAEPAGWLATAYFRLHGSPRMYASTYDEAYLDGLAGRLRAAGRRSDRVWCIFDNTLGGAVANALDTLARLT